MEEERGEQSDKGSDRTKKVWFCHHFVTSKSIYSTRVTKFPRLLNWIDINIGDKFMKSALAKGSVVIDVGVSKEELCYGMVKDACEKFGIPFKKQNRGDKGKLLFVVEEQTRVIADMQSSLNDLRKLVQAKNEDKNEEFVEEPLTLVLLPVVPPLLLGVAEDARRRFSVRTLVIPFLLPPVGQDARPWTFVLDPVAQDGRPYCARSGRSSMLRSLRTLVLAPLALKRSATVLYRPVPFSPPPISSSLVNSPGPNSFHV
ncbi:hypothetical protein LR48_Vigan11g094300 [Vigna angularis]|uniref:Uncharacterized protein n=1 Tax=Phaseolus angularis TaxID=3914 RepID=A0A0L9VS71_PHAAN|nr:hypothetical protein LR48_Vigan11g094300 [Vigna angularis]